MAETLNTNAYPLKLAVAALVMNANHQEKLFPLILIPIFICLAPFIFYPRESSSNSVFDRIFKAILGGAGLLIVSFVLSTLVRLFTHGFGS